uniref:Uncharacterized protein n=1 Tax=Bactrocera dorsalis TaxID=27457 RepID=A0A034VX95_BACDO
MHIHANIIISGQLHHYITQTPAVVLSQRLQRNPLLRCASYEPQSNRLTALSADTALFKQLSFTLPRRRPKSITTNVCNKAGVAPSSLTASPVSERSSGFSSIGSADERTLRYAALFEGVESVRKIPVK